MQCSTIKLLNHKFLLIPLLMKLSKWMITQLEQVLDIKIFSLTINSCLFQFSLGHVNARKVSASSRGLGSGSLRLGQDNLAYFADHDKQSRKIWSSRNYLLKEIAGQIHKHNDQSPKKGNDKSLSKLEIEWKNEEKRKKYTEIWQIEHLLSNVVRCLGKLREMLTGISRGSEISQFQVESLFAKKVRCMNVVAAYTYYTMCLFNCHNCFKEFCETLFLLFDHKREGQLVQDAWFSHIKNCSLIPG